MVDRLTTVRIAEDAHERGRDSSSVGWRCTRPPHSCALQAGRDLGHEQIELALDALLFLVVLKGRLCWRRLTNTCAAMVLFDMNLVNSRKPFDSSRLMTSCGLRTSKTWSIFSSDFGFFEMVSACRPVSTRIWIHPPVARSCCTSRALILSSSLRYRRSRQQGPLPCLGLRHRVGARGRAGRRPVPVSSGAAGARAGLALALRVVRWCAACEPRDLRHLPVNRRRRSKGGTGPGTLPTAVIDLVERAMRKRRLRARTEYRRTWTICTRCASRRDSRSCQGQHHRPLGRP